MTTITNRLAVLAAVAATLITTANAYAGDPVHGTGSSHHPIAYHPPVHGPGSSHNPISCVRGTLPGTVECHNGHGK